MKLRFYFKDPDGVYETIREAAKASVANVKGLSKAEAEALVGTRHDELHDACYPWLIHGEIAVIEIDTEAGTARICRADEN